MDHPVHSPDSSTAVGWAEGARLAFLLPSAQATYSGWGAHRKLSYPTNFYLVEEASPNHLLTYIKYMDVRLGGFVQIQKDWVIIVSTEQTLAE